MAFGRTSTLTVEEAKADVKSVAASIDADARRAFAQRKATVLAAAVGVGALLALTTGGRRRRCACRCAQRDPARRWGLRGLRGFRGLRGSRRERGR